MHVTERRVCVLLARRRSVDQNRQYPVHMASRPEELHEPLVVEIEDDFSRLPEDERVRLTNEWLESLLTDEPIELSVTGDQMVAEARAEMEW
jgi:hypothetical protein